MKKVLLEFCESDEMFDAIQQHCGISQGKGCDDPPHLRAVVQSQPEAHAHHAKLQGQIPPGRPSSSRDFGCPAKRNFRTGQGLPHGSNGTCEMDGDEEQVKGIDTNQISSRSIAHHLQIASIERKVGERGKRHPGCH